MRISTAYRYETMSDQVAAAQSNLFKAQRQISTGLKLTQPSDDPAATQQVIQMQNVKASLGQYQTNLQHATGMLGYTNDALSTTSTVVQSAYTLALQGASASLDPATRSSLTQQVSSLQEQLLSLANSQGPSGQYLFGGQKTSQAPYAVSSGALVFSGDSNSIQADAGPGATVTMNVPGTPMFENAYEALETLRSDLAAGNVGAISNTDVKNLQSSLSAVQMTQGTLGARIQQVTGLTNANVRRITDLTTGISNLEDADTAQAMTQYTSAQAAYQAALSMTSQTSNLSLANYLGTGAA